jgi:hypothetical protein
LPPFFAIIFIDASYYFHAAYFSPRHAMPFLRYFRHYAAFFSDISPCCDAARHAATIFALLPPLCHAPLMPLSLTPRFHFDAAADAAAACRFRRC